VDLRELDLDDVNGVCDVYPAGGLPVRTCTAGGVPPVQEQPPRPSSGGGCSTTGGGVISMLGVALSLGLRRSPRTARSRQARQDTITPA
jgi:uncharacterized protein (TIGR03382 family)